MYLINFQLSGQYGMVYRMVMVLLSKIENFSCRYPDKVDGVEIDLAKSMFQNSD